jgi:hypothetical protein
MRERWPIPAILALALGVVIGFVLGGISPRRDAAQKGELIVQLTRRLEERAGGGSGLWRSSVPGFDRILQTPDDPSAAPLPSAGENVEAPIAEREAGGTEPIEEEAGDGGVPSNEGGWREGWEESSAGDRLTAFQRAAAIQRVRVVQSRAALIEQAELTEEETIQMDEAIALMNGELRERGEDILRLAMGEEPPAARDLLGITHDVTGILQRAQLRLEAIVGSERVDEIDPSALEIWNHVDLSQLEPAARAAIERSDAAR